MMDSQDNTPGLKWSRVPEPLKIWLLALLVLGVFFGGVNLSLLPLPRIFHWPAGFIATVANMYVPLLAFTAAIAVPVFLIKALINLRRRKRFLKALNYFFACAVFAAAFMVLFIISSRIRTRAFEAAGENGEPIIAAISGYYSDNGEYPEMLTELVPDYLLEVPWTGLIGYPEFYYFKPNDRNLVADYELGIFCGEGILNWDRFFYWPSEQYPDVIYGGGVERIGRWAYVHE